MSRFLLHLLVCVVGTLQLTLADDFKNDYSAYNAAKFGDYPNNQHQGTKTKTPVLQVSTWNKQNTSRYGSHIFIRHNGAQDNWGRQDASPLILDASDLTAVYVNRTFPIVFNVRVQENLGKRYLTFYGDQLVAFGLGSGICHAYDTSYREVYRIGAVGLKVKADLHECEFTGQGTVIVSAYETNKLKKQQTRALLPGLTSPMNIWEGIFQEIDLETKKALFTWRASEHVDMNDSFEPYDNTWDFFHINSIHKSDDGNYLVSARHMHSIYLVNGKTGKVMWILGGRKNQFTELPPEGGVVPQNPVLTFGWQHHARFYGSSAGSKIELTFFDNHLKDHNEVGCQHNCSRGLHIRLDTEAKTVQLVREYLHPTGLLSQSQGSVQILDDGNVFIGWGKMPSFTEHTSDGQPVLDVQFSPWASVATHNHMLDNYRAFRSDWKAAPYWHPTIAAKTALGATKAYMSWNGATEVSQWVLFSGSSQSDVNRLIAQVPRSGFETEVPLGRLAANENMFLRAAALDKQNKVIGSTGVLEVKTGAVNTTGSAFAITMEDMEKSTETDSTDEEFVPLKWDFSQEGQQSKIAMMLFVAIGVGLSGCCLVYGLVLKLRHRRGQDEEEEDDEDDDDDEEETVVEQKYTAL